jgi:transcriptional regulator GlxA family with amidase domain
VHSLAIVAFDGVVAADLAGPCELFGRVALSSGQPAYRVRVCGVKRRVRAAHFDLHLEHGLAELARARTILVPGVDDIAAPVSRALIAALRSAARRGARIASVCSGAFVLAAAGLLDGKRATTHWLATAELARRYPAIEVDRDVLYVDEGRILSSAGAAAALDLCLHMVRLDHGAAVAAQAARIAVMPLERAGGQAQFIAQEPPLADGESLHALLAWLEENLQRELGLAQLARKAALSTRTLSRRFREQTGTTPLQWLLRARVRRAQHLLEVGAQPVERIAAASGFSSTAAFRERFRRVVGTSPQAYRRAFRTRG